MIGMSNGHSIHTNDTAQHHAIHLASRRISVTIPAGIGGVLIALVLAFVLGWILRGAKIRVAQQCQTSSDCAKGQSCSGGTCVDVASGKTATAACQDLPMVEVILRAGGR